MELDPFEACWQRWERAGEHEHDAVNAWNEYIRTHPFDAALVGQGDGVWILRVSQDEPVPQALAIHIGECLYNLRSALDYTIWATACYVSGQVPPPDQGVLQYPIYDDEAAWDRNKYRLRNLAEHHRAMLKTMQPFASDSDANYLGWINRLARIDRHRTLVTGTARLAVLEPAFQLPPGTGAKVEWGDRVLRNGYADAARITVSPATRDTEIVCNPRMGIDPEIEEWSTSAFWARVPFHERLKMMRVFVAAEIAIYEFDCTGGGRKASMASDQFRVESVSRPTYPPLGTTPRAATSWSAPLAGKASTAERFAGKDFPDDGPGLRKGLISNHEGGGPRPTSSATADRSRPLAP